MKAFVRIFGLLFAGFAMGVLWHPDCGELQIGRGNWVKRYGFIGYYTLRFQVGQGATGQIEFGRLIETIIATAAILLLIIREALHWRADLVLQKKLGHNQSNVNAGNEAKS